MNLVEALGIKSHEVVSLVGGGGKTTIMFALARELSEGIGTVITTTTTKILKPEITQTPLCIVEHNEEKLIEILMDKVNEYKHITIASQLLPTGQLKGIHPLLVKKLLHLKGVSHIIIEADGASRKPLKAPNATEPVIPAETTMVIAVVGIESIGSILNEDNVFRIEHISKLTGLSLGDNITTESVALLVTDAEGIAKGSPKSARIIPFLNKVDLDMGLKKSKELAIKILQRNHPHIDRIILGQAQSTDPVTAVVTRN